MFVIGVTGGIGCGKSTVARMLGELGLPVLDADQISRDVTSPGGPAVCEVVSLFGNGILADDGAAAEDTADMIIDRGKLASVVFKDRNQMDQLSAIVHRYVIAEIQAGVERETREGTRAVVLDVPIPVKEGFLNLSDYVIVVWADEQVRLDRLEARGMSRDEARRRMSMQMTEEEYSALASEVIRNDGTLDELRDRVMEMARRELGQRGIRVD